MKETFKQALVEAYEELFQTDAYRAVREKESPLSLAIKMTHGLGNGSASKDGEAVKRVCKKLGIAHSYKAIKEFLEAPEPKPTLEDAVAALRINLNLIKSLFPLEHGNPQVGEAWGAAENILKHFPIEK